MSPPDCHYPEYRFIRCWADEEPAEGFPGNGYYQRGQDPAEALERLEKRLPAGAATRYVLDTRSIPWKTALPRPRPSLAKDFL